MHENQQTKESETQDAQPSSKRPYKFYALVTHYQRQADTAPPVLLFREFMEFEDKASLRAQLDQTKYEGAEIRIVRGYEMKVKAKRQISIN